MEIGDVINVQWGLPSGYVKIAIETGHVSLIYLWKVVIFHSYVSLPEGKRDFWTIVNHQHVSPLVQTVFPTGNGAVNQDKQIFDTWWAKKMTND